MADANRPLTIIDGDTVRDPATGQSIRLKGGANTPESAKGWKGQEGEIGADQATEALDIAVNQLGYQPDDGGEYDKYGRGLQTFTSPDGADLSAGLISTGLAVPHINPKYLDGGVGLAQHADTISQLVEGKRSPLMQDVDMRILAREATEERVAQFNQWIGTANFDNSGAAIDLKWNDNFLAGNDAIIDRGLARGADNMQGMYYGFANALGEVVGSDKLAQLGAEGMARNMLQAMENPAQIGTYEDAEGFAGWFTYAAEAIAEQVPQLAADLSVAVATMGGSVGLQVAAGAGKAALRSIGGSMAVSAAPKLAWGGFQGVTAAGKAGAAASMYAQLVGETQGQFKAEGIDNPELALALGVPKAALDYAGLHAVLGQGLKALGKNAVTPQGAYDVISNATKAAGAAFGAESVTEGAQILIDELAVAAQKDGYEINTTSIIDGMLKGGFAGGGISGGMNLAVGTVQSIMQQPKNADPVVDTEEESLASIQAQLENMPAGKVRYFTSGNTESAKQLAEAAGKATRVLEGGQLQVANTQAELDALPAAPTEADNAAMLGYLQTKEEVAADPEGPAAVVVRDAQGTVIESQAVGASRAAEVVAAYQAQYGDAVVEVTTPEAVIAERQEQIKQEKARDVQAPGGFRKALDAIKEKVATAAKPVPPAKKKAPIKPKAPAVAPNIEDVAAAGVNEENLGSSTFDRAALNRVLVNRLSTKPQGSEVTFNELLGERKVRELSDQEAVEFSRQFGIELDALPRAKGAVKNKDGKSGQSVDKAYRLAAARNLVETLRNKLSGTQGRMRADLTPLADFLGLAPNMANRKAYSDATGYREAVGAAIQAKYGSLGKMVQAMAVADYGPSEVSDMLAALGAPEPSNFKFEADVRVTDAAKKAAVAGRLPTKDKKPPVVEKEQETEQQKQQAAKAAKAQKLTARAATLIDKLRGDKLVGRFFTAGEMGNKQRSAKLTGLFAPGKEATSLREAAVRVLASAQVDTANGIEALIEYADALIETTMINKVETVDQIVGSSVEPEDGVAPTKEKVVSTSMEVDYAKLKKLEMLRAMLEAAKAEGLKLTTVDKKGNAVGAKRYMMIVSDLAQMGDIQTQDTTESLLSSDASKALSQVTSLSAAIYGFGDAALSPAALVDDILGVIDFKDSDLAQFTLITPDGSPVTAKDAVAAVATEASRHGKAAMFILRNALSTDNDDAEVGQFLDTVREGLRSENPKDRRRALQLLERRMRFVTLDKLQASAEALRSQADERSAKPASASGVYDSGAIDKSEQQLSDWSFFGAMRRARAFFRAPPKLRQKDAWRRKEGEPSVFDTHETWVVDFETFFDVDQKYSLGLMETDEYIRDPRFATHGLAVTAPGQETRYLTTAEEIQAFIGQLKASEKPVALVAHNARFDGNVMSERFGFEPAIWIDTYDISRLADPEAPSHGLADVAQRLGMNKPTESLEATNGKRDLQAELSAEEYAAFTEYAKGDVNIALAYLQKNEPSLLYAEEANAALRVVRGVDSMQALSVEHFDFGDVRMRGVARSVETTRLLNGANLIMIPHRRSMGGATVTLPFDAVALAAFSQSGTKKAENAAEAATNLMSALTRLREGPESADVAVGIVTDDIFVPSDDTVIFLDEKKGPVTFGEAIAAQTGMKSRDATLLAAERTQGKLKERLGEVEARLMQLLPGLYKAQQTESSALREAALDVWMSRIAGEVVTDDAIRNGGRGTEVSGPELLAEVIKIGNSTNAPHKAGMKLSMADIFSEKLTILGELSRTGQVAKQARKEGAEGNQMDEETAARVALAKAANDSLAKAGSVRSITALTNAVDDALAARKKAKGEDAEEAATQRVEEASRALELALAAAAWSSSEGKVYPSDIPQHEVDSMLRGDGFAHVLETYGVTTRGDKGEKADGDNAGGVAISTQVLDEDPTMSENREGLRAEQRLDGVERIEGDGLQALYAYADESSASRAGDVIAALQDRGTEPRMLSRALEVAPAAAPVKKAAAVKGPAAKADPDARAPAAKRPLLGFDNKLGRDYAFLTPFINRLKQLNVPMDNVTLLSHAEAVKLWRANQSTGLGQLLNELVNRDGSAYFNYNGRSYILLDVDPSLPSQALEELAHEIGHAVKDRVWADLLDTERAALEQAFAASHPGAKADPDLLHEWFADQFMRAAISNVAKNTVPNAEEQSASPVAKAIAYLLGVVRNVWDAVSQTGEVTTQFAQFAERLFAGGYNSIGVKSLSDTTLRFASGVDQLSQPDVNRAQMAVNRVKQGWKKGVVPSTRALLGTVIGQMEAIDKGLAAMLFQRANADSNGGRAYEQAHVALANRMMAEKDAMLATLSKAKGKQRSAEVQAALADAFTGAPTTEAGKKARVGLDRLAELARKEGLRSVPFDKGFPVAVFDREAVERNRAAFVAKLVEKMGISPERAADVYLGIVEGAGTLEGSIAPGMPVGMHISTREILAKIPFAELRDGGWLLQEHEAALQHWTGGVAKRAAWEKTFGGFAMGNAKSLAMQMFGKADPDGSLLLEAGLMDDTGRIYSPNAKFNEGLNRIRATSGEQGVQRFIALLDGVMGRTGANMPQGLRKSQDFVTAFVNWLVLGFSGVASIPELATSFIRAGGKVGITDLVRSIDEGRRLAESFGIVLSDASQRIIWQATGEQYQSPMAQKMNYWLFKLNMNQAITNASRTLSVGVAAQYLTKAAADGDHQALTRLNIDAATVRAWDRSGRQAPSVGQSEAAYAINARVADAVSQFVNEATVSPSRFQATHWGNNPMFKLVWHLKHFMWAYGDTIIGGMWRDAKRRFKDLDGPAFNRAVMASAPMILFALAAMPLAAAALELRDWIRRLNGVKEEERSAAEYMGAVFDRAGGLGPLAFAAGAYKAQSEYGVSLFGALSPTLGKLDMMFTDYGKDGKIDERELLWKARQLTPIASQNKGLWPFG